MRAPDPEPVFEAPEPEPAFEAPEPEPVFETPEPEPVFETPSRSPPYEVSRQRLRTRQRPRSSWSPTRSPSRSPCSSPPRPSTRPLRPRSSTSRRRPTRHRPTPEPVAPLATEPAAPQSLPETNGQVPHDLEDDLLPPEPAAPEVEPIPAETGARGARARGPERIGLHRFRPADERRAPHGLRLRRHRRGEGLRQGAHEATRHDRPGRLALRERALPQARHDHLRRHRTVLVRRPVAGWTTGAWPCRGARRAPRAR